MPTQRWKVVVTKLGATGVLHDAEVDAANWMGALRAVRQAMAERPSVPPGVSCSIDSDGTATVLDPGSRRKFVLSPLGAAAVSRAPSPATATQAAPAATPEPAAPPAAPPPSASSASAAVPASQAASSPAPAARQRFQTVALAPEQAAAAAGLRQVVIGSSSPGPAVNSTPAGPTPSAAPQASTAPQAAVTPSEGTAPAPSKKKKFETQGFVRSEDQPLPPIQVAVGLGEPGAAAMAPSAPQGPAAVETPRPSSTSSSTIARPNLALEILLARDEAPTQENPLTYRERAYLLPKGTTVTEAEAALRWQLADLQQGLSGAPRGKLVNLAIFDHRWTDVPERPPLIVLQWRDWRAEVAVDYPAASRASSMPPSAGHDDRLAEVFEALEALTRMHTPVDALDFVVRLLERTIPAEATSACLYDINTDQLRFVSVGGAAKDAMQGQAIPRAAGLFGPALRSEHQATVFADVLVEPAFNPSVDSREGLDPHNVMVRPVVHDHQLLGALQLINRQTPNGFSAEDVHVMNYIAERLADFLYEVRTKAQPKAQGG